MAASPWLTVVSVSRDGSRWADDAGSYARSSACRGALCLIPRRFLAAVVADTIVRTVELGVTITDAAVGVDAPVVFCDLLDDGRRHCPGCGREGIYRDTVIRRVTDVPVVGHPDRKGLRRLQSKNKTLQLLSGHRGGLSRDHRDYRGAHNCRAPHCRGAYADRLGPQRAHGRTPRLG